MTKQNNQTPKKGGNNRKNPYMIYYIYALIGIVLIGSNIFMNSNPSKKIQSQHTFMELMKEGYVENVILWRNVGRVDFHINEEGKKAVKQGDFSGADFQEIKTVLEGPERSIGSTNPKISFDIASTDVFIRDFDQINQERKAEGYDLVMYKVDEEHNYLGQILSFLLPIIIIIAIWIFIMRRMSGGIGAGGGAGGQLFNIGKSRAKVFEKGEGTDVSFKDVAGLEGAKEEVQEIVAFLKNPRSEEHTSE